MKGLSHLHSGRRSTGYVFRAISLAAIAFAAVMPAACAQPEIRTELPVRQTLAPLSPVGEARGVNPGRVAWSHAPGAASWDGGDGFWFDDAFNSQQACDWLVESALCTLTGTQSAAEAWNVLFVSSNRERQRGDRGYEAGETVTIKINNNNTYSHDDNGEINASPQMVLALLRSLVGQGGVPQLNIIVAEPSRYITDYLFDKCHTAFPEVRYLDNSGGDGRVKAEYRADAMVYSQDNGPLARGIATAFTDADYVINMALLKGHVGQGVTLCGKNWYGTMSIHSDWRRNFHNNFNQSRDGSPKYITFVDFMGHGDLGGKCMLYLVDGLYGCRNVGGKPGPKWSMEPFGGDWPCSLFASQDPVAIDMVGVDFLTNEFPDMPDVDYSDMYLSEAAQAGNAPSGTVYDPEGDGIRLGSLGVAEHWDNATDKRYSRNLGRGEGIELVLVEKDFR